MAASDFTLDSVKEFMLSHRGRVKNHELVTHFKGYLNDPDRKGKFDSQGYPDVEQNSKNRPSGNTAGVNSQKWRHSLDGETLP